MSRERAERGPHLTRRQFLIGAGGALAATLGVKYILEQRNATPEQLIEQKQQLPIFPEQVATFSAGAYVNLMQGIELEFNPDNMLTLIKTPSFGIHKPEDLTIIHFMFDRPLRSANDKHQANSTIDELLPDIKTRLNQEQGIDPNQATAISISSLDYILGDIERDVGNKYNNRSFSDIKRIFEFYFITDWLSTTRGAVHTQQRKPDPSDIREELTPEYIKFIHDHQPLKVTKLPATILKGYTNF